MPAVGRALKTVEGAIRALVPLVVASVTVLVIAAGAFGTLTVDLVLRVRAVGQAIRRAVASAAARSILDADSRAVELCECTVVRSVYWWALMKIMWRRERTRW